MSASVNIIILKSILIHKTYIGFEINGVLCSNDATVDGVAFKLAAGQNIS